MNDPEKRRPTLSDIGLALTLPTAVVALVVLPGHVGTWAGGVRGLLADTA